MIDKELQMTKKRILTILILILIFIGIMAGYFHSFHSQNIDEDQKMYSLDEYKKKFSHTE